MKRFLTLILTLSVAVAMSCGSAFASYKDVTDSYPASQEISIDGDPISASEIPDGTYNITATTSSYMCVFSNVTITVENGSMAATFTCSKAYTRLYLGTAEEAAAQTNADGTDDSAYYKGTPADGYTPHVYTLPVSQLNAKLTVAAYAGATTTKKWYTRTAVFFSSDEVAQAIANGGKKEEDSSESSDDDSGNTDDANADDNQNTGGGSSADSSSNGNGSSNSNSGSSGSGASASGSKSSAAASSSTARSASEQKSSASKSVAERIKNASAAHAVEISLATAESVASSSPTLQNAADDASKNMTPLVILLVVIVVTLALAALVIVAGVRISRMRKRIL